MMREVNTNLILSTRWNQREESWAMAMAQYTKSGYVQDELREGGGGGRDPWRGMGRWGCGREGEWLSSEEIAAPFGKTAKLDLDPSIASLVTPPLENDEERAQSELLKPPFAVVVVLCSIFVVVVVVVLLLLLLLFCCWFYFVVVAVVVVLLLVLFCYCCFVAGFILLLLLLGFCCCYCC